MAIFTENNFSKNDDYMTQKETWDNIKGYIPKDKLIWECFYGDGKSGEYLRELGFEVIHDDIDFFNNDKGEIIISNPPYSKKKKVLTRLKKLDKPFIMICPISMLNTQYLRNLYKDDIQLIIPNKRMQFLKLENGVLTLKGRSNFDTAYFCYKIGLKRQIIFL